MVWSREEELENWRRPEVNLEGQNRRVFMEAFVIDCDRMQNMLKSVYSGLLEVVSVEGLDVSTGRMRSGLKVEQRC